MKKFYTIILIIITLHGAALSQSSGIVINENFTSVSLGNLGVQNGWIQTGISTDVKVANTTPLIVPNYPSGGQYVTVGTTMASGTYDGRDPYKTFIASTQVGSNPAAIANNVFYLSFVVRVTTPRRNGANIDWLVSLRNNEGKSLGHFFVKQSSVNASKINFGINTKPDIDSTKADWTPQEYNLNTTYLIVIRYDIVRNSSNDAMYLWVNPATVTEPTTATAQASMTNGQEDYSPSGFITSYQLTQREYCSSVQFDGFRVAYGADGSTTAVNSAAAWTALNPFGTPLPVKFISFDAARIKNDVLIQWSTSEEYNNSHYEVERSVDGTNFSSIATINGAGNSSSVNKYSYTDKNNTAKTVYYRIKQVDIDGKFTYTSVKMVKSDNNAADIRINSTGNNLVNVFFSKPVDGKVTVTIISMSGQVVAKHSLNNPVGQNLVATNTNTKGIYVVRIEGPVVAAQKVIL